MWHFCLYNGMSCVQCGECGSHWYNVRCMRNSLVDQTKKCMSVFWRLLMSDMYAVWFIAAVFILDCLAVAYCNYWSGAFHAWDSLCFAAFVAFETWMGACPWTHGSNGYHVNCPHHSNSQETIQNERDIHPDNCVVNWAFSKEVMWCLRCCGMPAVLSLHQLIRFGAMS